MYCGRCGAEIKDKTARFCDNCGAPLKRAAVRMTMAVKIHIMEEVIAETVLTVERVPIMMAEMGHTELMISRIITEETEPITAHIITEETELIMGLTTGAPVRTSRMTI